MSGLAALATGLDDPRYLLDVVNWAALWLPAPWLAGRVAGRPVAALLLGGVCAMVEISCYYGGPPTQWFDAFWLSVGVVAGAVVAGFAHRSRGRRRAVYLLPLLMMLEPVVVVVALRLLGRSPWSSLPVTGAVEFTLGLLAAVMVWLCTRSRRARLRRAAPAVSGGGL
jgi:hypothetical protein